MVILDKWKPEALAIEKAVFAKRATYQAVCDKVNPLMPWYFVGIIDTMEASGGAKTHLHNGDSLARRTVNVPAGRPKADPMNGKGTPYTFLESACDAITLMGYHVQKSWTLELMLGRLEKYNGLGCARKGICTPYLWSGTNHYTAGKYTSDGIFDPKAVSKQLGAAVILRYVTDRTIGMNDSARKAA
jgi:lysozyme family protein